jgi:heptosyltransferase-2
VIGAAHGTKRWPVHKWKEFCRKLNHPVILLGDKNDVAAGDEIASVDPIKVYNACGKFGLNESADLVRKSKLVVSNDTGLMHIAAACKKPIISLWGNTVPSFGMTPYYGAPPKSSPKGRIYEDTDSLSVILQTNKLWCRPCSKIGFNKCPLGHFKCMESIEADEVINKAKARL